MQYAGGWLDPRMVCDEESVTLLLASGVKKQDNYIALLRWCIYICMCCE